jgi:phosphatidylserine synthase
MAGATAQAFAEEMFVPAGSKRRIVAELVLSYGLILLVIWTPRPWQKHLWWVAAAAVVIIAALSFTGLKSMGLRTANFLQSIWIVAAALLLAAVAIVVAIHLDTLRLPPADRAPS